MNVYSNKIHNKYDNLSDMGVSTLFIYSHPFSYTFLKTLQKFCKKKKGFEI